MSAAEGQPVRFTVDQVATASTAMRVALGLPPKNLTKAEFVISVADEVAQLRVAGWDDAGIADLIGEATGEPIGAADLALDQQPRRPEMG